MKPSFLAWSLLSLFSASAFATSPADSLRNHESRDSDSLVKRADTAAKEGSTSTIFNGVEVPPMKELTPENFDETIKDGYWLGSINPEEQAQIC